jgi:nitrogen fixation protein NifU and related proteins
MKSVNENKLFDESEGVGLEEAKKTYSPSVIDHFLNPRNQGALDDYDCYTYMSGICGDTVGIYIVLLGGRIDRIGFVTNGCGPTIACGSALTCLATGMAVQEAKEITGARLIEYLGGMPIEHTHCADLAVNTLRGALEKAPRATIGF